MKHIYVGFSSPRGWFQPFSWLIRKWQATQYSHVFVIFPAGSFDGLIETSLICEAAKGSVRNVAGPFFFPHVQVHRLFKIELDDAPLRDSFRVAASFMGANYSFTENLGIVFASIFGLKKNPFGQGAVEFKCSELVYYILSELGFNFDSSLDPDLIDVRMIAETIVEMAEGHPKIFEVSGPQASDLDLAKN